MGKNELIRELALRTEWPESDPIPLTLFRDDEKIDVSDGGKYYLQFRDASGKQKALLGSTLWKDLVRVDEEGKEYTERYYDAIGYIKALFKSRILVKAVLPKVGEDGEITSWMIDPSNSSSISELIDMLPDTMIGVLVGMSLEYLNPEGVEEVVEEAKNLPSGSDTNMEGTEPSTSLTSSDPSEETLTEQTNQSPEE